MKPYARHRARALVLQAIFQWQFATSSVEEITAQYLAEVNPNKVDIVYFKKLLVGITKNVTQLDQVMEPLLDRKLEELDQVEYAILRLAIYELVYCLDVPYKVVINEALELAKKFGSVTGYKYINGVLDKVVHISSVAKIRKIQ